MRPDLITDEQWRKYNYYFILEHFIGLKRSEKYLRPRKNKLFQEILKNDGIQNRGRTVDISELEAPALEPYLKNRDVMMDKPLVFRGAAKDWPCMKKWDKEYFRRYFSEYKISLVGNVGLADKENQNKHAEANMGDFVDSLGKDKNNYLRFSRIIDDCPDLKKDMNVAWMDQFKYEYSRGGYLYLFMGEDGSKTDMHNAIIQSLFVQIKGKKRWTIYAPNERIFLDPKADRRPYYYSHANPNKPEDPDFPLLSNAIKYVITLEEGDVLWFPSFFWHYVENIGANIGVTYKFTDFAVAFKLDAVLSSLLFLGTKPTIVESFLYNVFKGRDLLFDKH